MKNGKYIEEYGFERWYKDGLLHREDGPAVLKHGLKKLQRKEKSLFYLKVMNEKWKIY